MTQFVSQLSIQKTVNNEEKVMGPCESDKPLVTV